MSVQRFDTIQLLRGVAATLVVAMHALHGVEAEGFHWNFGERVFAKGLIGVDIFFVISGFIIFYIGFKGQKPSFYQFMANRFWRIFPPYWAVLTFALSLSVGLAVVFGDASKLPSMRELLTSIFLIPAAPKNYVIGVAWTLGLELVFYALFALVALRFGANAFFLAILSWYGLGVAGLFLSGDFSGWAYPLLNPVVLEFLYGALIAHTFLKGNTRFHAPAFVVGALAICAILLLHIEDTAVLRREIIYGIPSALLIYGAIGVSLRLPETVMLWGESSYILYLLHLPFFMLVGRGLEILTDFNVYSTPLSAFGMVVLATLTSMAISKWIERPYQKAYKARLKSAALTAR